MITRHLFSQRMVAFSIAALQMAALGFVSGQTAPRLSPVPLVRTPLLASKAAEPLLRARGAMKTQNFAQAYAEYRAALNLAARTGPEHDEALRGFSESGVKLAQQQLKEGHAPEAERIAREVLAINANYRPALEVLARAKPAIKDLPVIGSGPPPDKRRILPQATPPPRTKGDAQFSVLPRPSATVGPREVPMTSPPPQAFPEQKPEFVEEKATPPPKRRPRTQLVEPIARSTPPPETGPPTIEDPQDPEEGPAPKKKPSTPPARVKQPLVKVFFATDRQHAPGAGGPSNYFGTEWNDQGDNLTTGVVTVSIPPVHKEGVVERPFKWWIIEFKEDPKKHFVLTDLNVMKSDDFYGALRHQYEGRAAEKRSAFVFIHGFTVAFDEAAFNTAQIAYDLDLEAVPILYSWPSQERLLGYAGDQEIVDWSSPHLQRFLERVARESGALQIHVLAHSMGNRLLARALVGLARQPEILPLFENVIMAAPDVNAKNFAQDWPEIRKAAKRFTLYASSDDKALAASRQSKGGVTFTRLGEGRPNIVVIPGLDTVDASGIDTSLLGHSYADSCKPVMNDLKLLMGEGWPPDKRNLRDQHKGELAYWSFP